MGTSSLYCGQIGRYISENKLTKGKKEMEWGDREVAGDEEVSGMTKIAMALLFLAMAIIAGGLINILEGMKR
ncbi:MAG: hypothetical protein Q8Q24_00275 [bacterium]|nr:hypothetical protein [bacterium]